MSVNDGWKREIQFVESGGKTRTLILSRDTLEEIVESPNGKVLRTPFPLAQLELRLVWVRKPRLFLFQSGIILALMGFVFAVLGGLQWGGGLGEGIPSSLQIGGVSLGLGLIFMALAQELPRTWLKVLLPNGKPLITMTQREQEGGALAEFLHDLQVGINAARSNATESPLPDETKAPSSRH